MIDSLRYVFNTNNFEAHGAHFVDTPILFWVFIIANLLIFASYILIPITLVYLVRKRKDIMFTPIFLLFAAFIVLCGIHHLLHVITFWYPIYGIESVDDVLTALVSLATFFAVIHVLPFALRLKTPQQLEIANTNLSNEIERRERIEAELTAKNRDSEKVNSEIIKKNEELLAMNQLMIGRELRMAELKSEIESLKKQ